MPASPYLILSLLLTVCFSLAAWLEPREQERAGSRAHSGHLLAIVLGEGQRLLADLFFVKADAYFHRGYYRSVFDAARAPEKPHVQKSAEHHAESQGHQHDDEHEREMDFLGEPKDWIDRFGRPFYVSQHAHLDRPEEARELLPWLRFSAALDPQREESYIIAAFWLRTQLDKEEEAMQFLREGWRANPDSHAILLELGRLFYQGRKDAIRARNVWELALRKWEAQEAKKPEPDLFACAQILAHLADLEEREGRLAQCVEYLERLQKVSPHPDVIRKQIEERKLKLAPPPR